MLGLIVNTIALMAILWMLARHEADLSFGKTVLVVFGITFGCSLLGLLHPLAAFAVLHALPTLRSSCFNPISLVVTI